MMTTKKTEQKLPFEKINAISDLASEHIDLILNDLNLRYEQIGNRFTLSCPIHDSDNRDSMTIYKYGKLCNGNWICFTSHCEKEWGSGLFNFIRAYFTKLNGRQPSYNEVVNYLMKFTNPEDIEIQKVNKTNFIKQQENVLCVPREIIRKRLIFPSAYFIERGFSEEILDKYDVGTCITPKKPMYNREVVPIYNNEYTGAIGCVGRSKNPQCVKCKKYHLPKYDCPKNGLEEVWASKWRNSKNLNLNSSFYNFWFAKDLINSFEYAILVEGQGDVWKLEEAGYHTGLGLYGDKITYGQIELLKSFPTLFNIIIATDSDSAGSKARITIKNQLSTFFNIHELILPKKDFGDMSTMEIHSVLDPIITKL